MIFGGPKMGKNMKIQNEHGQMLLSGALDPRKLISYKIPKKIWGCSPSKTQFLAELLEQFGLAGVSSSQSIAEMR